MRGFMRLALFFRGLVRLSWNRNLDWLKGVLILTLDVLLN